MPAMPRKGSVIEWFGTRYICDKVEGCIVWVVQNNGVPLPLWWRETQGNKILEY